MEKSEGNLVRWIASRYGARGDRVLLGVGDDMAMVRGGADGRLLLASDMLLDGVHFDSSVHTPEQIGRKALAVNLSDCAAMAVRPVCAVVSVALPSSWTMSQAQGLYRGMEQLAREYDCAIVGGDTNSWPRPLVIDVAIVAEGWKRRNVETSKAESQKPKAESRKSKVESRKSKDESRKSKVEIGQATNGSWQVQGPVLRSGLCVGDGVWVTGRLGGSLSSGHHLAFSPRVWEARALAEGLGPALHAMMDLSDGLSMDGDRLAAASGCGIELDAVALETVASEAARAASAEDGRSVVDHVLNDGEDFELLFGAGAGANCELRIANCEKACMPAGCSCSRIGTAVEGAGVWLVSGDGSRVAVEPGGWEHWKD